MSRGNLASFQMLNEGRQCKPVISTVMCLLAFVLVWTMVLFGEATADWREELKVLKVGIVEGERPQLAKFRVEPFREALQEALQIPVKIVIAKDYKALISAHSAERIDYAVYSATAFATTWLRCMCVEPIVAAKLAGGDEQFYSILIVNRDKVTSLSQLQGKRVAASGKNSLTNYLLPVSQLQKEGLQLSETPDENQARIVIAGSSAHARRLFLSGTVDGLFGWSTLSGSISEGYSAGTLIDLIKESDKSLIEFHILWKSSPIPNGPHAVLSNLPDEVKALITKALMEMYETNPVAYDAVENYRSGGFATTELANYQTLIDFLAPTAGEKQQ